MQDQLFTTNLKLAEIFRAVGNKTHSLAYPESPKLEGEVMSIAPTAWCN